MAGCRGCREEEDERAEDDYWRVEVAISGQGVVRTANGAIDCGGGGRACGPHLFVYQELKPPFLEARPAPGWRFDHWESMIRSRDGTEAPRPGPMPDGRLYLNGFGDHDTGALDRVRAVFAPAGDGGQLGVQPLPKQIWSTG